VHSRQLTGVSKATRRNKHCRVDVVSSLYDIMKRLDYDKVDSSSEISVCVSHTDYG
jgi:hypothetical protein